MDDVLTNAGKIHKMNQQIEELVNQIPNASQVKAESYANYDRAIAIASAKIKNGDITEIEDLNGEKIPIGPSPANLIPIYAKGICYKEAFDKIAGEAKYKGVTTMIDARKAQLNGLQSINKVLQ